MRALLLALLLLLPNTARAEPVAPIADPSSDPALLRLVQDALTSSGLATFGVAVRHLPSGRTALVNPDLVFEAASLYKLMVMYEAYQQIGRGQLALNERLTLTDAHFDPELGESALVPGQELTVDDALESMITVSETAPALALLDRISYRDLAPDLRLLGLEATRIDAGVATSPRDMLRYFQIMAQLGAVGPEASQQMLGRLTQQRVRDRIGRQLPPGTLAAHKTGNLPGVAHDAGIIYTSAGPLVLAMLAQDVALEDDAAVRTGMARLAGAVARYALDGGFSESAAEAPLWDLGVGRRNNRQDILAGRHPRMRRLAATVGIVPGSKGPTRGWRDASHRGSGHRTVGRTGPRLRRQREQRRSRSSALHDRSLPCNEVLHQHARRGLR